MLAVDVSPWLRPDAATSPDRLFCHVYGRGRNADQYIPGWPYSFIAALEPGRTSWTAILDAVRLGPDDDVAEVTAVQVRAVVQRLVEAGQWRTGDPDVFIVFDAGYDLAHLAFLLTDLPVEIVGRIRADRVLRLPAPPREPGLNGRPPKHGKEFRLAEQSTWPDPAVITTTDTTRLRHRRRRRLGPAAPAAHPPGRMARPPRRSACPGRHADLPHRRPTARRPRPETGVAMVLPHRSGTVACGQTLAGIPPPLRPRTHLPPVQTDPRLDRTETPRPARGRPMDLADHHLLHPTPAGPHPRRRSTPALGTPRPPGPAHPGPCPSRVPKHPAEDRPSRQRTKTRNTRPRTPTRIQEQDHRHPP